MSKYLIIPVDEIEEQIRIHENETHTDKSYSKGKALKLKWLLETYKQVSLDVDENNFDECINLLNLAYKDFESTNTKFAKQTEMILAANDWVKGYRYAKRELI